MFVFLVAAQASEPIRVVSDSLAVPPGLDAEAAIEVVRSDLASIFTRYEPVVPGIPGVNLALEKRVVSAETPVMLELPIQGGAFGTPIDEQARITATSVPFACPERPGVRITLDFDASSYNVARRIDRIEVTACPREVGGGLVVDARGEMYAGFLPKDPDRNALAEGIGASAMQGAFIRQVPAVFDAVREGWVARASDG